MIKIKKYTRDMFCMNCKAEDKPLFVTEVSNDTTTMTPLVLCKECMENLGDTITNFIFVASHPEIENF